MTILNALPSTKNYVNETQCCPKFKKEDWDDKYFSLDPYHFVKAASKSLFYMPLNLGAVMTRTMEAIVKEKAEVDNEYLILSKDISPWACEHYFLVKQKVSTLENVQLFGNFYTKVYDGPYKKLPQFYKEFENTLAEKGHALKDCYTFYTTCPKCAKHYGENIIILFGKI